MGRIRGKTVRIETATAALPGLLRLPASPRGIVIFADGFGGNRFGVRTQMAAGCLEAAGFGTLLLDLLTPREEQDVEHRADLERMTNRLIGATLWLTQQPEAAGLPLGLFGSGIAAAPALRTAAELAPLIRAVVARGGRPDLAADALIQVQAPTLIIIGGEDTDLLVHQRAALLGLLRETRSELAIVPDAGDLFEEPAALEHVTELATHWFRTRLRREPPRVPAQRTPLAHP